MCTVQMAFAPIKNVLHRSFLHRIVFIFQWVSIVFEHLHPSSFYCQFKYNNNIERGECGGVESISVGKWGRDNRAFCANSQNHPLNPLKIRDVTENLKIIQSVHMHRSSVQVKNGVIL